MRLGMLIALCGGVMMFALTAFREGSNIQGSIMLVLAFVIAGLAMWFTVKRGDK